MATDRTRATLLAFQADVARRGQRKDCPGAGAAARFIRTCTGQAFDVRGQVTLALVGDDWTALALAIAGRHTVAFRGILATGRAIAAPGSLAVAIWPSRIATARLPVGEFLRQIGGAGEA